MPIMISVVAPIPYNSSMTVVSVTDHLLACSVFIQALLGYMVSPASEDIMSGFTNDNFHHLPAPSARLPFSPALDTSESTISPTFSNFSPSTSSSYSIPSPDSAVVNSPSDPDDAWNLIPYNVSWGHEYEEYRAGILPGPEGDCVFLRSPTPLRNQRASEACKKCRERKAKVRPSLHLSAACAQPALLCYPSIKVYRYSAFVCSLRLTRLRL